MNELKQCVAVIPARWFKVGMRAERRCWSPALRSSLMCYTHRDHIPAEEDREQIIHLLQGCVDEGAETMGDFLDALKEDSNE